ncbi:MAG: MarR family winged helix-turn-helix transcriptional regulator [Vicinamibacterales bacterium]
MADPNLDPALSFMRLMWSVDHGLQKVSKRMAASIGLTGPQRLAIRIIGRFPSMTAGDVATLMHLDPSTVTGILRRLVDNGMIVRHVDPGDARRVRLSLTEKGRDIDRRSAGTVEAVVRRTLARLPPHQIEAAARVLALLASQLLDRRPAPAGSRHARRRKPARPT